MPSLLTDTPLDADIFSRGFERYNLARALENVRHLLEAARANKLSKAEEFYTTIEKTLIALDYASVASQNMNKAVSGLRDRVDLLQFTVNRLREDVEKQRPPTEKSP